MRIHPHNHAVWGVAALLASGAGLLQTSQALAGETLPTITSIVSANPSPSEPLQSIAVTVAVRAAPPGTGQPAGVVRVRDGAAAPYTRECLITLAGTPDETGNCTLTHGQGGIYVLEATYLGNGGFAGSSANIVRRAQALNIVHRERTEHLVGEATAVQVALEVSGWQSDEAPTGSIVVTDGTDQCVIILPAPPPWQCLYRSGVVGTHALRAIYSGDLNYPTLTSASVDHVVHPRALPERISVPDAERLDDERTLDDGFDLSADGRYLVFDSHATLAEGDTNARRDIYLFDRHRGATARISIGPAGVQANQDSSRPSVSGNGRFVAFDTSASNLLSGTSSANHVLVHDRDTGLNTLVSRNSAGDPANFGGYQPQISDDGRFVTFLSQADNLAPGVPPFSNFQLYLHDRQTGSTSIVSVSSAGVPADNGAGHARTTADGRYVVFQSGASNLAPGDDTGTLDVYLRDMILGTTTRLTQGSGTSSDSPDISADGRYVVYTNFGPRIRMLDRDTGVVSLIGLGQDASISADGQRIAWTQSTQTRRKAMLHDVGTGLSQEVSIGAGGIVANADTRATRVSANGRYVGFSSRASNLVAGDSNGNYDLYVRDLNAGLTQRASLPSFAGQGLADSLSAAISADGNKVAFLSRAANLVATNNSGTRDIYLRDRRAGTTSRVAPQVCDSFGLITGDHPSLSADGAVVAFCSAASDLVLGDTNGKADIFVYEPKFDITRRVSATSTGVQADENSQQAVISANGRFVAFASQASNLEGSTPGLRLHIYRHDLDDASTRRISKSPTGQAGSDNSYFPRISADGRYVAFVSTANNLIANDTNGSEDVFVYDAQSDSLQRASVTSSGQQVSGSYRYPSISADGRLLAFTSTAQLVPGGGYLFLHDRASGSTVEIEAGFQPEHPQLSGDGSYLVFRSFHALVPQDTNNQWDIYVHNLASRTNQRVSLGYGGVQTNGYSAFPAISRDGRVLAFESGASNLVPGDSNDLVDVFVAGHPDFLFESGFEDN